MDLYNVFGVLILCCLPALFIRWKTREVFAKYERSVRIFVFLTMVALPFMAVLLVWWAVLLIMR